MPGGRNPPWTPGDTTEVDSETRKSKGQGMREQEERNCIVVMKRKEERENRRQRRDEAGEWEKGKSPNTYFLQRPGPL